MHPQRIRNTELTRLRTSSRPSSQTPRSTRRTASPPSTQSTGLVSSRRSPTSSTLTSTSSSNLPSSQRPPSASSCPRATLATSLLASSRSAWAYRLRSWSLLQTRTTSCTASGRPASTRRSLCTERRPRAAFLRMAPRHTRAESRRH